MLCTKVANKFFFFNYNLQFIEQERRRTGGKVATAGRLSLIKNKKDASEGKANFAASIVGSRVARPPNKWARRRPPNKWARRKRFTSFVYL